nr:hypothetical protein [Morchella crassipes]
MKVRWTRASNPLFHTPPTPPCLNRRDTHPPPWTPPHPLLRRWWGGSRGEGLLFYLNFALFKAKQVFISPPPPPSDSPPPTFHNLHTRVSLKRWGGRVGPASFPPFSMVLPRKRGGDLLFFLTLVELRSTNACLKKRHVFSKSPFPFKHGLFS